MIKLQVIGHLGKDAIVNNVNGKNVINFSVAHSESYKDAQGVKQEKSIWVECAYWTDRTGIVPYLKKGTQVYAEGQPDVRTYTAKDGKFGASLSMRISNVQLLGGNNSGGGGNYSDVNQNTYRPPSNQPAPSTNYGGSPVGEITEPVDDLPF